LRARTALALVAFVAAAGGCGERGAERGMSKLDDDSAPASSAAAFAERENAKDDAQATAAPRTEGRYGIQAGANAYAPHGMAEASAAARQASSGVLAAKPMDQGDRSVPLDPNGRYATTYRPGAGHLAAFESAIARGIIPASEREIVSDIGSAYSAALPMPKDHALGLAADFERTEIAPSGGKVHLRINLQSTDAHAKERPHLSVAVVLDVSGSMAGERIASAQRAAEELVDRLDAADQFSFVTFSTSAQIVIPLEQVGPNRASIKHTIDAARAGGGTNIGDGLKLGYAELHGTSVPADAERVTFLLSDGQANEGITSAPALAKLAEGAFQDGIQTSSFGMGTDYDGPLMSQIAEEGAGGYYYLRDAAQIPDAVTTEIEKRLDPVATALEVRVRLKPGVEVLEAYGSHKLSAEEAAQVRTTEVSADKYAAQHDHIALNRQDDKDGGMRFFIPAFARNEHHAILLELRLPAGVGEKEAALVELKYKDRVARENVTDELQAKLSYATSDAESAKTENASVERTVQGFEAGEALMDASRMVANGDSAGAARLLSEREGILREAATKLNEPRLAEDATRLARMREHVEDKGHDPLVLAMMMETAGSTRLR